MTEFWEEEVLAEVVRVNKALRGDCVPYRVDEVTLRNDRTFTMVISGDCD